MLLPRSFPPPSTHLTNSHHWTVPVDNHPTTLLLLATPLHWSGCHQTQHNHPLLPPLIWIVMMTSSSPHPSRHLPPFHLPNLMMKRSCSMTPMNSRQHCFITTTACRRTISHLVLCFQTLGRRATLPAAYLGLIQPLPYLPHHINRLSYLQSLQYNLIPGQ